MFLLLELRTALADSALPTTLVVTLTGGFKKNSYRIYEYLKPSRKILTFKKNLAVNF